MSINSEHTRCRLCGTIIGINESEDQTCFVCCGHNYEHKAFDPRCPRCIVEQEQAKEEAAAFLARLKLPIDS